MENNKNTTARALALELLQKSARQQQFSNIALDKALERCSLSDADKRLTSLLFYGVTERKITLDYRIAELSSRPIDEIDPLTLDILRLGLYQLTFTEKIPPHAAINETVKLCTRRTAGFVNGILRAHTRGGEIVFPDRQSAPAEYLSVKYSVCRELCDKFIGVFGIDKTESIFTTLTPPPTTLRVNTLKISRDELAVRLGDAEPTQYSPVGLKVKGAVRSFYGFDDGLFFVQDEASQICVQALDARSGMTVMDVCACPGSKTFGAAINMENRGRVLSYDLHEKKLSLILSGANRLGIDIVEVTKQDGRAPIPELFGRADRVLCDVPCSGFGVLAKKPELRYKDPAASSALPDSQLAILENACRYVKNGGVLVYSTCTVFPEENQENVERFLTSHPEFTLTPFCVGDLSVDRGYVTLLPDVHHTDGFFIAKLTKKETV